MFLFRSPPNPIYNLRQTSKLEGSKHDSFPVKMELSHTIFHQLQSCTPSSSAQFAPQNMQINVLQNNQRPRNHVAAQHSQPALLFPQRWMLCRCYCYGWVGGHLAPSKELPSLRSQTRDALQSASGRGTAVQKETPSAKCSYQKRSPSPS